MSGCLGGTPRRTHLGDGRHHGGLDRDAVAVSPSRIYRVLKGAVEDGMIRSRTNHQDATSTSTS